MINPTDFVRLTLDPVRLAILGRAALGPVDATELAGVLGTHTKQVLSGIARLREAGLLTEENTLNREALRELALALPDDAGVDPAVVEGPWSTEEVQVLSRFFSGSKLTSIPTNRSKRLVVLDRLATEFEPGLRYTERHVNLILKSFHPDFAALRRYLVDDGFLTRADGVYWRSGGRTGG
ncbi:MAG: DUF2087 domain-containing protein [Acidimicrobiia bacterium]|nr:DUF2087 domain-containing protein [Acidimicrobiia bacterium]